MRHILRVVHCIIHHSKSTLAMWNAQEMKWIGTGKKTDLKEGVDVWLTLYRSNVKLEDSIIEEDLQRSYK